MKIPTATYRLQFRDGMTFDRAAMLTEYLATLGVSHLYASPLFAAAQGSTHGYDGIDFARIEPAIGGEAGFEQLAAALHDKGLALLLDFVPNHMATAAGNRWWDEVLAWGRESPYAAIFDIDWSAPKLLLPILGSGYEEALMDGCFAVQFDAAAGRFFFACYDRRLPMNPRSYALLLGRAGEGALATLAADFAVAGIDDAKALTGALAALANAEPARSAIAAVLREAKRDKALLDTVHDAQVWQLVDWRRARQALTYRRFFEIADLICLRVEAPDVFDAVHARLIEIVRGGQVAGVRLDHIDGLADPKAYLERLQQAAEADGPLYLLVEKILEQGETLRPDWPVSGTTGYEFIALLAGLFVDPGGEGAMSDAYESFVGQAVDYAEEARNAKRQVFAHNLAAELAFLVRQARAAAGERGWIFSNEALHAAILELAVALPVYRTYVDGDLPSDTDRALIETMAVEVQRAAPTVDGAAADFVCVMLTGDAGPTDSALAFRTRFQQTTGPVIAKGIEDTLFYRFNRLIALNEVGGAPDLFGGPLSAFHQAMTRRLQRPGGLSATSTHDTKRGEDARARLYVLSELPDVWRDAVLRWSAMNAPHRTALSDGMAPEPVQEWAFYQALLGAWPADKVAPDAPLTEAGIARLRERMLSYMEKAIREAKLRTSWLEPDTAYEAAVARFVAASLSADAGAAFLRDFRETCFPLWIAGAINSLAQLAIKLAAPGVPDIYQGTELWDVSLVDPDNRAPVDFDLRRELLASAPDGRPEELLARWQTGAPKLALTRAGLRLRATQPVLFETGAYVPLTAEGPAADHVVAFARQAGPDATIVVAPRFVANLTAGCDRPLVPAARWQDTDISIPQNLQHLKMQDVVTGVSHSLGKRVCLATILEIYPVAILATASPSVSCA